MKANGVVEVHLHSFLASALDGMIGHLNASACFTLRKASPVRIGGGGWAPEPFWTIWRSGISLAAAGMGILDRPA
jgi:hypothetical protein